MIRVGEIKLKLEQHESTLKQKIAKRLRIHENDILEYSIYKRALDARKRNDIHYAYTVDVKLKNEKKVLEHTRAKNVTIAPDMTYYFPQCKSLLKTRPVIIGFGPAGMFSGLLLAEMGLCPIILERGEDIDKRSQTVQKFWQGGELNTESNVQFGEGGAGTFSDGKLTARSKDIRSRKVLQEFVEAGAPKEILYDNKPHIGTDKLKTVVKNIRKKIISLGGEVYFESKVTDLKIAENNIKGVIVNDSKRINTETVILATGHSARDMFELLYKKGIAMEQKPFAMGVRIEHKQSMINTVQYGENAIKLPPADYKLTYTTKKGRGVYTFCMCPGGYVVNACSEKCKIAVNGMSEYKRDGENANSALLVQIFPEDLKSESVLAGIVLQRELEQKAYQVANGSIPVQLVGDFLNNTNSNTWGDIKSTCLPQTAFCSMYDILPHFMTEALKEALIEFGKKLKGFDNPYAVLTAIESRSSSPVRIIRNQQRESITVRGLYPTGEGAGYAGGIVSAAIDGIIAAEQVYQKDI
ncbi:FAD-dependent protein [Lachnospiraceae bacterium 46-61]